MKATELMIGDWVYNPFTRKELRITSGRDIDLAEGLCLEPIPITIDILEKNGFHLDYPYGYFQEDKEHILELCYVGGGVIEWTINCNEHTVMSFEYVHELQHALRLCGVEKDIEL